jgi:hypothetical protein
MAGEPRDRVSIPGRVNIFSLVHSFQTDIEVHPTSDPIFKVKVKLSLQQAVEVHRVARGRGSHILSRLWAHKWR